MTLKLSCSSVTGCFVPTPVRSDPGRLGAPVTGSLVAVQYFCLILWFRITESSAFKHSFPAPPPRLLFPVPSRVSSNVPSFGEPPLTAPSRPNHTLLSVPKARVTLSCLHVYVPDEAMVPRSGLEHRTGCDLQSLRMCWGCQPGAGQAVSEAINSVPSPPQAFPRSLRRH